MLGYIAIHFNYLKAVIWLIRKCGYIRDSSVSGEDNLSDSIN